MKCNFAKKMHFFIKSVSSLLSFPVEMLDKFINKEDMQKKFELEKDPMVVNELCAEHRVINQDEEYWDAKRTMFEEYWEDESWNPWAPNASYKPWIYGN